MVAIELFQYVQGFSVSKYVGLEDFSDRANFQGNIIVLLLSMAVVSLRQYFMNPMVCYISTVPGGSSAESYITDMCWVEGTVPLNFSAKVSHKDDVWKELEKNKINYYQWVPFVLGLQAILYYLPKLLWQIITYNRAGMDLEQLVQDANDADREDSDTKDKIIDHISRNLEIMLYGHRSLCVNSRYRFSRHLPCKRNGNMLVSLYFLVKILYLCIGVGQLILMYYFLGFDRKEGYKIFGYRILHDILHGKGWTETQIFPRLGMCRHSIEQLGNLNHVVAQCLLPINMLNEKIYIFLYFFILSVLALTAMSIPLWIYRIFSRTSHRHLVKYSLKVNNLYDNDDSIKIDRFVVEFLRQDGNFILRMLSMNVGDLITSQIVCSLYNVYLNGGYAKIDLRSVKTVKRSNDTAQYGRVRPETIGLTKRNNGGCPSAPNEKEECFETEIQFF